MKYLVDIMIIIMHIHFMKNNYNEQYNENLKYWKNEVGKYVRNPFLKDPDYFLILIIKNTLFGRFFSDLLVEPFDEDFEELSFYFIKK